MNTDIKFDIPDDEFQIILSNIPTPIQQIHEIDEPEYVIKNDITIYEYMNYEIASDESRKAYIEKKILDLINIYEIQKAGESGLRKIRKWAS